MTDNEIIKSADNETVKQRVKAIYPHITVSGAIDKPYYNIDWYDIEKNTMYRGFSSYNLELVHKWLEEEFEVVEADIDDLINRQKAEKETMQSYIDCLKAEIERLKQENFDRSLTIETWKVEAIKEFATDVINDILPKYMQGHSEQALKISLAISKRANEMEGEI